jgi:hypothetical protein
LLVSQVNGIRDHVPAVPVPLSNAKNQAVQGILKLEYFVRLYPDGRITGGCMSEDKYPIQEGLSDLKKAVYCDPTNVEAANRYWAGLALVGGNDLRSGGFVIEAFRGCALASNAGTVALARAFRELFEKSGEKPRAELFDGELLRALKTRLPDLLKDDRMIVQWVIESIG